MAEMKSELGSIRMFRIDVLEWFTHVHSVTPVVIFAPLVVWLVCTAAHQGVSPLTIVWQMAAGYVSWTLVEYWLHRLFFHLPVRGPMSSRLYFFAHGVHHERPRDASRLVMPPVVSIALAALFYLLLHALLPVADAHNGFAGLIVGYLIYDTVHWYTHACKPCSQLGRYLRKQHMLHHFKQPSTRFGVSCPWWDVVFRTTGE